MSDRYEHTEPLSDEQLVAYLDGEMDAAAVRRIEQRLADDDHLRNRLHQLDRTWQLLDQLETDAAGRDFTRTTLEMVAAAGRADRQRAASPWRRVVLATAALLAAGLAGFLTVATVRPDPNHRLLHDLPVLENLDSYRAIDSFEFLTALHGAGLFSEPSGDGGEAAPVGLPDAARKRVEAMTPDEKEQLRRRQEQFAELDSAQQGHLRRLAADLAAAPHAAALQTVAAGYYNWLKALPPIARAELLALAPQERVEKIENVIARQAEDRIRRLGPEDARALGQWLSELSDRMVDALPESAQARIRQETDPQRRRGAVFMFLQAARASDGARRPIEEVLDESDLAELHARLTERTRSELQARPSEEQWRIIREWIPQLMRHRVAGRGPRGVLPEMAQEGLAEFFEHELDDAELDRLLALPAEEMQRELQRLYLQRSKPGPSPVFRRPGPALPSPRHRSRDGQRPRGGERAPDGERGL